MSGLKVIAYHDHEQDVLPPPVKIHVIDFAGNISYLGVIAPTFREAMEKLRELNEFLQKFLEADQLIFDQGRGVFIWPKEEG